MSRRPSFGGSWVSRIAAVGQSARAAFDNRRAGYVPGQTDGVRRKALTGALTLLMLWAVAYLLLQLPGLLIVGGITLFVAILGWFKQFVVVDVEQRPARCLAP